VKKFIPAPFLQHCGKAALLQRGKKSANATGIFGDFLPLNIACPQIKAVYKGDAAAKRIFVY